VPAMVIQQRFAAPVERVWNAWVDAEQVKQWWGPQGLSAPVATMDVREGGTSLVCMRSPDGHELYNTWTYERVVPHQRLEFMQHFVDRDGKQVAPASLGLPPGIPNGVRHVLIFESRDGVTDLTITEYGYTSEPVVEMSKMGMQQVLDKLTAVLSA
jgi:uncharacterized protein YndB with AHSA1/START domain